MRLNILLVGLLIYGIITRDIVLIIIALFPLTLEP